MHSWYVSTHVSKRKSIHLPSRTRAGQNYKFCWQQKYRETKWYGGAVHAYTWRGGTAKRRCRTRGVTSLRAIRCSPMATEDRTPVRCLHTHTREATFHMLHATVRFAHTHVQHNNPVVNTHACVHLRTDTNACRYERTNLAGTSPDAARRGGSRASRVR
jgi:hypothetical protein